MEFVMAQDLGATGCATIEVVLSATLRLATVVDLQKLQLQRGNFRGAHAESSMNMS
jgi:hypothetical protein